MRSKILVRWGIASLLIGGGVGGMFAAGCGGDDNGTPGNNLDSGTDVNNQVGDDATGGDDTGIVTHRDGGPDADAGPDAAPPVVFGKLILVHASAYAPPLRFCFGLSPSTAALDAGPTSIPKTTFPAPNTELGLPPGTGGAAAKNASDLKGENITIFGINARAPGLGSQIADAGTAELNCSQIVGDGSLGTDAGGLGLVQGRDYWNLGTLPAGTVADGTTTLVTVTGCAPGNTDTNDQALLCPPGYDPAKGNLGLSYARLDTTTVLDGGSVGAQVAYGSYPFSQYAKLAGGSGAAAAGFFVTTLQPAPTPDAGDAGDASTDAATDAGDAALADAGAPVLIPVTKFIPVAAPITYGQVLPTTSVVPVSGLTFDSTSGVAFTAFAADGGSGASVGVPFPSIQAISYPGATTAEFANGVGYVFVLVGTPLVPQFLGPDGGAVPSADAGTFNPLSPHILGFPTNPPFGN
jgi:hypothetical protein